MTDTDNLIHYQGGNVLATDEPLTVRGLLLPYGEVGRTNIGRFQVEANDVVIPTDPAVVGINTDHVREDTVGRAVELEDTEQGVYATYKFADTEEGRAAYEDAISPTGKRRCLSAEFGPVVVKAGKLANKGGAKLWGSAMVEAGAFPSAMVLASDTPDELTYSTTDPTPDTGDQTASTAPAAEETTPVEPAENEEDPTVGNLQTLAGGSAKTEDRPIDPRQVFAAIATLRFNPEHRESYQVLAALQDITLDGTNPLLGSGVARPNWVGLIDGGVPYQREYIQLGKLGTAISVGGKEGFTIGRGTSGSPIAGPAGIPNGGDWAGNKADINSYKAHTVKQGSFFRRFAVGDDIGRELFDLPGGAETVEALFSLIKEDHLYWSDMWALFDLQMSAGVPVAANTYPTDYPAALGMLLQGVLAVKKRKPDGRRDIPTYAIANDEAYSALVYAAGGAEHLPAFIDIAITTNSNGTVDGNVQVVQGDTGIYGAASVIVGAKSAVEFDELAGGPLIVNALEVAKGGVDRAVHGYLQTFHVRDEATVLIGASAARANSTAYVRGQRFKRSSNEYIVVKAGTSAGSGPTEPAVGATVEDGTAVALRLS